MLKDLYQNRTHYLVLFAGLFLGLFLFFTSNKIGLPGLEIESIIGLCVFYFIWGVIHHWLQKDLHIKIVLEYFLVASIACFLLLSLIWRA